MREVVVTVGTRAAGKSTFCEKALILDPTMVEVSRDKILIALFGKTSLDPYTGGHFQAYEMVWEAAKAALAPTEVRVILDVWNGSSVDRRSITNRLREMGANRIVAWYFTTPVETVEKWFWQKPGIAKISDMRNRKEGDLTFYSEDSPRSDHELFHRLASDIDSDGFDQVIRINPVTTDPEHVLHLQTNLKL